MATNPLTAGFDSAIAETNKVVVAAPAANEFIEVTGGELSVDAAAKATLHFGSGDPVDGRIMGGYLAAGGGSASVRGIIRGALGEGLFYTSDAAVNQTLFIRYKLTKV